MSNANLDRRAQVEAIWAERLVHADALNAERLAQWESRKALIFERDLPVSIPKLPKAMPAPVVQRLPARSADIREFRAGRTR